MANETVNKPWYHAAMGVAVVAGVFSAAVAALLVVNHLRARLADPLDSPDLAAMKESLLQEPRSEALKERIRALDHALRVEYFRRQAFAQRGAYLLVGGLVALVAALRYAAHCRKVIVMPKRVRDDAVEASRQAEAARWSVGGLGLALAALALVWGIYLTAGCTIEPLEEGGGVAGPPAAAGPPSADEIRANWGRFRGPGGLAVATAANIPTDWDGKTGRNILWKAEVPLPGHGSPVVWGGRVYLSGATKDLREVFCFDAHEGKLLWRRPVQTPQSNKPAPPDVLDDTGYAPSTPAADGRYVAAIFANGDLGCFESDGKPLWMKNLGVPDNQYGHAASLLIYKDLLIVPFDQAAEEDGKSRLLALDLKTGRPKWEAKRPVAASWSTPILIEAPQGPQVVTAANPLVAAYDPETGAERWRAKVLEGDVASSPVFAGGLVYATSVNCNLSAIRPGGPGDVTKTEVAWKVEGEMPDTTSPAADDGHVWVLKTDGLLSCFDSRTGRKAYEHEFEEMAFKGSPAVAGGRVYVLSTKGIMVMFATGGEFKELGRASLGEPSVCSPAFLQGRIYIRGRKDLYAIGSAGP